MGYVRDRQDDATCYKEVDFARLTSYRHEVQACVKTILQVAFVKWQQYDKMLFSYT